MKKDNQFVAMVYKVCPVCGKVDKDQSEILLHRRFGDLSEIDGQATGYGDFCKDCQQITKIAVACVVVDFDKSEGDMKNPYRTGNIMGMSEDWVKRALPEKADEIIKKRMFFMDYKDALEIGLPIKYDERNITPGAKH